jgi:hypothetical protein
MKITLNKFNNINIKIMISITIIKITIIKIKLT